MAKTLGSLPIGAKVKDIGSSYYGKDIVFIKLEDNHAGYPANSTTLLTEKIIALKAYDAKEPNNSVSKRQNYGNNRYIHSNIRQWLNSSANSWYKAQHSADTPPTKDNLWDGRNPYDSEKGFMANLRPELRSAILPTALKVLINEVDGGGLESFTDKIFIPSSTEVGTSNTTSYDEGTKFDYFKSNSDRVAHLTKEYVENSEYDLGLKPDGAQGWWTRTPSFASSYPEGVLIVDVVGSRDYTSAYRATWGVRPALNLSSETKVSSNPDKDGAYVISQGSPPTLSGSDTDLGIKNEPFSVSYTVNDEGSDAVTIVEKLNGVVIREFTATLGEEQTLSIDGEKWLTLPNGKHTFEIEATNAKWATDTRVCTFTKAITKSTVSLETPLPSDEKIIRTIMSITRNIPIGANFKVEVCNNGFDEIPTWKDITQNIELGSRFFFTNQTNTAGKWGYNFRIEIDRGSADSGEEVYISSVGGNFE